MWRFSFLSYGGLLQGRPCWLVQQVPGLRAGGGVPLHCFRVGVGVGRCLFIWSCDCDDPVLVVPGLPVD